VSKFNVRDTRSSATGPIVTETVATGTTHEGAPGYARDAKSELFLLAVSNMVGEQTFYEKADQRDERYEKLVEQVAVSDADWTLRFLRWLRGEGNMRSASLVGAAEAVRARLNAAKAGPVPNGARNRQLVEAVLQRADEPGELLAYWTSRYGRAIPKPIKRGIGDAIGRLYTEYNLLKYDTDSKGFRFADVIDLVHPSPTAPWQGDLFAHALDRRHGRAVDAPLALPMVTANAVLRHLAATEPGALLDAERLKAAGMTWEDVLSLVGSKLDKVRLWAALIPSMGYMALLRNLRNFDQAGVPDDVADQVAARLADPEQVARSRQFPFRFYAAHIAVASLRWGHALEKALAASLGNVPALGGRTLILVDQSPSMFPGYYFSSAANRSDISNADQAKLFGSALALRAASATLVGYGHVNYRVPFTPGEAVLRLMGKFRQEDGTDAYGAAADHFDRHDRIVIVTDGENNGRRYSSFDEAGVPRNVPIYEWNIGGYKYSQTPGRANRHTFGGLTDHAFRLIPLLEAGRNGDWPF
jgi:hypothetical protein